jgi:hypothetical protein
MAVKQKSSSGFMMIFSFLLIIALYFFVKIKFPEQNTLVAQVDEKRITLAQLRNFANNEFGFFDWDMAHEWLDLMINQEVLIIHAEKSGVMDNVLQPLFDKQIRYASEKLMLDLYFEIDADANINISNEDIRLYYQAEQLFTLRSITIPPTDDDALTRAETFSRELRKLQNFEEAHDLVFPERRTRRSSLVSIINVDDFPDYLLDVQHELQKTGDASNPVDADYGLVVFYRDAKPPIETARSFIVETLRAQRFEAFVRQRTEEIMQQNRLNLFVIDNLYKNKRVLHTNEVLVTNSITNDRLTETEFIERLADLYDIHNLYDMTLDEMKRYINLFIGQKVLLSLARENNFYSSPRYTRVWNRQHFDILTDQYHEIVAYMLEDFHEKYISNLTDKAIHDFYHRDQNLYRKSDFWKLQTVVTSNRNNAIRAYNEAIAGLDFDEVVIKFSEERYTNLHKGVGPYQDRNALDKAFDFISIRNVGDILQPIEVEPGVFHVYKILEHVKGAVRPMEEVQSQVITKLTFELMSDYIREIVNRHNIHIKVFDENLKPPEPPKPIYSWEQFKNLFRK